MPRGGRSALPRLLAFRTLQARNEEGRHPVGVRLPSRWSTRRRVASRAWPSSTSSSLRRGAVALPLTGGSILRLAAGSVRKTAEVPPSRCSPWIVLVPESPSPNPGHSISTFAGFRSRGRSRVDPFHRPQPPSQAPRLGAPLLWPDRPTSHPALWHRLPGGWAWLIRLWLRHADRRPRVRACFDLLRSVPPTIRQAGRRRGREIHAAAASTPLVRSVAERSIRLPGPESVSDNA